MAPLATRQNHSFVPSPPAPATSPSTPLADVKARINPAVFSELFAGTIGIFILAVVVWKSGRCIRSFNRHKVLREGKCPTIRFAKTWYGWVEVETHERNKRYIHNIWLFVKKWTSWKSTRADYKWVWWDPEQEALQARIKNRRPLRWLPKYLMSYDFPTPNEIWNPKPLAECHGALISETIPDSPVSERLPSIIARDHDEMSNPLSARSSNVQDLTTPKMLHPLAKFSKRDFSLLCGGTSDENLGSTIWVDARMVMCSSTVSRDDSPQSAIRYTPNASRDTIQRPYQSLGGDILHQIQSFDGNCSIRGPRARSSFAIGAALNSETDRTSRMRVFRNRRARNYRAWAAQMQVKAADMILNNLRDSSGPPGTPITDIMASIISEPSDNPVRLREHRSTRNFRRRITSSSRQSFDRRVQVFGSPTRLQKAERSIRSGSKPDVLSLPLFPNTQNSKRGKNLWNSVRDTKSPFPRSSSEIYSLRENVPIEFNNFPRKAQYPGNPEKPFPELSDWEIRLMDRLNRKLTWMFHETTPGQKPYHFALLANHWLNRETWLVYDPISRVSTDARRQQGDPRYNTPYPMPDLNPRPKYPASVRKRAYIPQIDSWRAAVNRHRRASGIQDIIPHVELYEDSAEEPPDGHIDPASWLLPKPPQGFEMSSKQKEAWYEGGAGWQEKLDDWQRVKRGYRLHKALHEGRAHRNRIKEIATNVNGYYRRVSAKLTRKEVEEILRSRQSTV